MKFGRNSPAYRTKVSPDKFLMRSDVSCSALGYDTMQYANLAEHLEGTQCIFEAECVSSCCVDPDVNTFLLHFAAS